MTGLDRRTKCDSWHEAEYEATLMTDAVQPHLTHRSVKTCAPEVLPVASDHTAMAAVRVRYKTVGGATTDMQRLQAAGMDVERVAMGVLRVWRVTA